MKKGNTRQYAAQLLDRLIELDAITSGAYYEMGRILSAIKHGKLWDALGYDSYSHMVEEELTFSLTTSQKYVFVYRRFKQLHYTESEALDILTEFGIARTSDFLAQAKVKVGKRAIANAIDKIKAEHHQINFTVNEQEYNDMCKVLEQFGARQRENGWWEGSSEAFVNLIKAAKGNGKPALRVVS